MDLKLLNILRCPACKNKFNCHVKTTSDSGKVITGELNCVGCDKSYPILNTIPRFVPMDNYSASFGYQWNTYKYTQVDKFSNTSQSKIRFFSETGWTKEKMMSNWILEVGCGNGRFLEISSSNECNVVGVDMSSAIDAAADLYKDRDNVHLVQASIYELPFEKESFDKCYCIGVIQHTPDVRSSIQALPPLVKKNGELALTIYERKPWTCLYGKYLLRPLTKRMNKKLLLNMIKLAGPLLFLVTEVLFRLPFLGKFFQFIIPFANYVDKKDLSIQQRYEWAILDTFDMLSPAHDNPMTEDEIKECLSSCEVTRLTRLPNPGVNVIAIK